MNIFHRPEKPSPETLELARAMQTEIDSLTNPSKGIDEVFGHYLAQILRERIDRMNPQEREAFLEKFFNLEEAKQQLGQLVVANTLAENRSNIAYEQQKYGKLSFTNLQLGQTVTLLLCDPRKSKRKAIDPYPVFPRWARRLHAEMTAEPNKLEVISDEVQPKYGRAHCFSTKDVIEIGWMISPPDSKLSLEPAVYLGKEVYRPQNESRHSAFTPLQACEINNNTQPFNLVVGQVAVDGNYIFPVQ